MARKTYVHRATFEVIRGVDDHRDVNFPLTEWSPNPSGLDTLVSSGVPARYWLFDPPGGDALREANQGEKASVDTDANRVAQARSTRRAELYSAVTNFIDSRYSARTRAVFTELRVGAPNAIAALLDTYFTWHRRVWTAYRRAAVAINQAPGVPEIEAVNIDFAALIADDPGLDLTQLAPP
jgi:hypothetical protein